MTSKEKMIGKYVGMLNDLKKMCIANEDIRSRELCNQHKVGHMSVKAAISLGYVKKMGPKKYRWLVSNPVTPVMARAVVNWINYYTEKYRLKRKNSVGIVVEYVEPPKEYILSSPSVIVSDTHVAKDDCEITKLKYQAMLDHQKIVDLEAEVKNASVAVERAYMDVRDTRKYSQEIENTMERMSINQTEEILSAYDDYNRVNQELKNTKEHIDILIDIINQVPTVTYYLFGIPVWKRKEKVSR